MPSKDSAAQFLKHCDDFDELALEKLYHFTDLTKNQSIWCPDPNILILIHLEVYRDSRPFLYLIILTICYFMFEKYL
jgi:hypothetical protein